ncbi:MAG: hypothetical protein GXY26_06155 [Clostridiales bacterium]|nr:hypothetical protein [Clostridiales bacterium]
MSISTEPDSISFPPNTVLHLNSDNNANYTKKRPDAQVKNSRFHDLFRHRQNYRTKIVYSHTYSVDFAPHKLQYWPKKRFIVGGIRVTGSNPRCAFVLEWGKIYTACGTLTAGGIRRRRKHKDYKPLLMLLRYHEKTPCASPVRGYFFNYFAVISLPGGQKHAQKIYDAFYRYSSQRGACGDLLC